jgi:hypothetical protein
MSLIRDAHYNATAARICRQDGHRITGDRCGVCRIRRDVHDVSPYVPGRRFVGGVVIGRMVEEPRTSPSPNSAPAVTADTCRNGHTGRLTIDRQGFRDCYACGVERNKRYRQNARDKRRYRLEFGRAA